MQTTRKPMRALHLVGVLTRHGRSRHERRPTDFRPGALAHARAVSPPETVRLTVVPTTTYAPSAVDTLTATIVGKNE